VGAAVGLYWFGWWVLLAGLAAVGEWRRTPIDEAGWGYLAGRVAPHLWLVELWRVAWEEPWETLTVAALLHAAVPARGVLLAGWAGRDEPALVAAGRATRRLCAAAPHAAAVAVLASGVLGALSAAVHDARSLTAAESVGAQFGDLHRQWSTLPWWARYAQAIAAGGVVAAMAWAMGAVLAAVGAVTWGARCRWPGRCEGCGYPLTGLGGAASCPECGRPLAASLGPGVRPGVRWTSARWLGLASVWGYAAVAWRAAARPGELGRALRVFEPDASPRWFLAVSLGLLLALHGVVVLAVLPMFWPFTQREWVQALAPDAVRTGGVVIAMALGSTIAAWALIGAVVGRWRRGALTAACRGACYLSALVVVYAAIAWAVVLALVLSENAPVRAVAGWLGMRPEAVTLLLGAGLGVASHGFYLVQLGRLVCAARHANR